MVNNITIYGELHTDEERARVNDLIKSSSRFKTKERFLLLEDLEDLSFNHPVEHILSGVKYRLPKETIKRLRIARRLRAHARGIDLNHENNAALFKGDIYRDGVPIDLRRSFQLREARMLSVINECRALGDCIVILGDTHLRTIATPQLGPASPIWETFKNDRRVVIHRSPVKEIE